MAVTVSLASSPNRARSVAERRLRCTRSPKRSAQRRAFFARRFCAAEPSGFFAAAASRFWTHATCGRSFLAKPFTSAGSASTSDASCVPWHVTPATPAVGTNRQPVAGSGYDAKTWGQLLLLTLCAQLVGHTLLNRALAAVGATTVSLAILLETPGAALLAWVWLGQRPPFDALPGLLLLLCGVVVVILGATRANRPVVDPALTD